MPLLQGGHTDQRVLIRSRDDLELLRGRVVSLNETAAQHHALTACNTALTSQPQPLP